MDYYNVNVERILGEFLKIYFSMSNAGNLNGLKNTTFIFLFP